MVSKAVLDTLFLPLSAGMLSDIVPSAKQLFLNAQAHPALSSLKPHCVQSFKPYAVGLSATGHMVQTDLEEDGFAAAFIALPKNQREAEGMIARAVRALADNGILVVAADNKAGGARLPKTLKKLGIAGALSESKNKARVMWAHIPNVLKQGAAIQAALDDAAPREIADGAFMSVPGIYGWDKIDKGSALLAAHLPDDLKGAVADFGCGYGYLSRAVATKDGVKSLMCIDADARAVEMCRRNLAGEETVSFAWQDLCDAPYKGQFDVIVMNPPFHEGKDVDTGIGKDFIASAHAALKPRGMLYMVANAHLPYETVLAELFFKVEKLAEENGFKVYKAAK